MSLLIALLVFFGVPLLIIAVITLAGDGAVAGQGSALPPRLTMRRGCPNGSVSCRLRRSDRNWPALRDAAATARQHCDRASDLTDDDTGGASARW